MDAGPLYVPPADPNMSIEEPMPLPGGEGDADEDAA